MDEPTLSRRERLAIRELIRDRRARDAQRAFVAEGRRVVGEALSKSASIRFLVFDRERADKPGIRELIEASRRRGVPHHFLASSRFEKLSDVNSPQGVLAVIERREHSLKKILERDDALVVVADGIQDPTNAGVLVRTCLAFDVDALLLTPDSADAFGPKAVRAASGAVLELPVFRRPREEMHGWKASGIVLLAAASSGPETLEEMQPPSGRCALIFGNEGRGVSESLRAIADRTFRIPICDRIESLNVTSAAAISLHHLARGRTARS